MHKYQLFVSYSREFFHTLCSFTRIKLYNALYFTGIFNTEHEMLRANAVASQLVGAVAHIYRYGIKNNASVLGASSHGEFHALAVNERGPLLLAGTAAAKLLAYALLGYHQR